MLDYLANLPVHQLLAVLAEVLLVTILILRWRRGRNAEARGHREQERFSSIHELASTLATSSDPVQMIGRALDLTLKGLGLAQGYLMLHRARPDDLACATARGLSDWLLSHLAKPSVGEYLASNGDRWGGLMVFPDLRRPDLIPTWQRDPLFREFSEILRIEGLRTVVVVGLQAKSRSYGALLVASRNVRKFHPSELRLVLAMGAQLTIALDNRALRAEAERYEQQLKVLRQVADQLSATYDLDAQLQILRNELKDLLGGENFSLAYSLAIENARLFKKEQRRARELALMNQFLWRIAGAQTPKEVLSTVPSLLRETFGFNLVRIETIDRQHYELVVESQEGYGEDLLGRRSKLGVGLASVALEAGEPVLTTDVTLDRRYVPFQSEVRASLSIPLRNGTESLGVLTIESLRNDQLSQRDVRILSPLAENLAATLHKAQAHEKAQKQAIRDDLTGLKTREYLMHALTAEWHRSPRLGQSFSLVMVEILGLEQLAERLGRVEADRIVLAAADLLARHARKSSVVARYEAERFCILLPDAGIAEAEGLVARLRDSMHADRLLSSRGVTPQFRVVSFPTHGVTMEDLLRPISRVFSTGPEIYSRYRATIEQAARVVNGSAVSPLGIIAALAFAVDARDSFTRLHSHCVSELSAQIGEEVGLSAPDLQELRLAGFLHDVGKIGVPESLLTKPSQLTLQEHEIVRSHVTLGDSLLQPLRSESSERVRRMIRHHHEWFDGSGYPDGLSGEQIPQGARILAIAECYDTMVSVRPYKARCSSEQAIHGLRDRIGTQLDGTMVAAFLRTQARPKIPASRFQPPSPN